MILLGFNQQPDDTVEIPTYETLRYFLHERLGSKGMDELMIAFVKAVKVEGEKHGIQIGVNIGEDAVPVPGARNDEEMGYNGHYKMSGWKADIVLDLDYQLPLTKQHIGINDDEGKCFPQSMKTLTNIGIKPENVWFDGKYATYENIAIAQAEYFAEAHYNIAQSWTRNSNSNEYEIKRQYNKHWREKDFVPGTDIGYMMKFLVEHDKYECVGAYFRNARMAEYEEVPDTYLDDYHNRNKDEGFNGKLKNVLNIEICTKGKYGDKVDLYTTLSLVGVLAVAVTKLQRGIKKNLGSVAYLT